MKRHTALTIAGSDSSGGAGIQADLKTMLANGVYGMSVITAVTAQNTLGVAGILEIPAAFVEKQIDAVFTDIFPDAVKIGMVTSAEVIERIAERLSFYHAKNIVIDPVMASGSGTGFADAEVLRAWKEELFPLATLVTPNIPECETLLESKIETEGDRELAAEAIGRQFGCAVLVKGGHGGSGADDLLWTGKERVWFPGKRIGNPNTHGTGCTLSSAIASCLAKGCSVERAVGQAKAYLSGAIGAMLDLGLGSGPMDHGYQIKEQVVYRLT